VTVVVGVDFSPGANHALRQADHYARVSNVALKVVSAWPLSSRHFAPGELFIVDERDERRWVELFRERVTSTVCTRTGRHPGELTVDVSRRRPEHALSEASRADGCRLVAVGSRGHGVLARAVLGSVAAHVVRSARCPVLVARAAPTSGEVVVAVDLSPSTRPVLEWARDLAARRDLRLTLLHAERDENRRRAMTGMLDELHRELGAARTVCQNGAAAESIVRSAEQLRAELVVIGATGERTRSGFTPIEQKTFGGSGAARARGRACRSPSATASEPRREGSRN
jgi:nucleotide-binding universal stress UspA family protein